MVWLPRLMKAISDQTNLVLTQGEETGELLVGQWRANLTTTAHWNNKVTLQLSNATEMRTLNQFLKNKGIRVHGREAPIILDSIALDLPQEASADTRGRPHNGRPG
jgi:hypothetical protein